MPNKVLKRANEEHVMPIQSTYLCAHAVPIGRDAEEMTEEIVTKVSFSDQRLVQIRTS